MKRYAFLALCLGLLFVLQCLLVPKYMVNAREGALTGEYYACAGENDVIFIGDCEVYENFSPITLWEEYGIPSYIRGSAQQMIWQSYYLLEEVFRLESPKVVIFNVLSMKYDTPQSTGSLGKREAFNRMTLDTMRWSASKWNAIEASVTDRESMASYLFPILRYHERWNQLSKDDFTYIWERIPISHNGYLMQTRVKPVGDAYAAPPLIDYRFGENSWNYLEKIRILCEDNGAQLVLIKAPSLYPVWYSQWNEQIQDYAKEHNLLYLNLLDRIEEIGIDWDTDTYDAGLHLNVWGAEKATSWLGRILQEQCGMADRRDDEIVHQKWNIKIERYYREKGC